MFGNNMQKVEQIQEPICTVNGERVVKRYKKIKVVGEGSYSKCWLVRTLNSDSEYVAKVIPKTKLEMLVKEKLVYEIKIHQQLSHPNVVHLDHWFEDAEYQYIFMEYCSEGNLERRLQANPKMSEKEIAVYVRQVITAISYIHSKGILHRDLKLCNFYIDSQDTLKLGDFGFACQLSHEGELKRETCGTPNYIAPEAVSGFGYSLTSDVWAVGIILYRLKYRSCPFEGKTVKETLQKVKICQYSFPGDKKISAQLKDLIERILIINYDDRLSLEQMLMHPFFESKHPRSASVMAKPEQKGFSLFRLFSKDKDREDKNRQSRDEGQKREGKGKQEQKRGRDLKKTEHTNKRSNSCETFKEIKQILKNKSKGTLVTNMGTELRTEQNLGMTLNTQTNRNSMMGNGTMRSIAETSISMNLINRRLQQNSRVNHFMGSVKQQLKMTTKPMAASQTKVGLSNAQQLSSIAKKYYLPYEVQLQRDVAVVHYKQSIKQIIYHGSSYLLHRNKKVLYQMNGQLYLNPPKLLRYLVDNKIEIAEAEPEEDQYGENTIEKILLFVAHRFVVVKDGIVLWYGTMGMFVAKMMGQQLFYVGTASKEGQRVKEDNKLSLMYARENRCYKYAEGVVLSRIYQGWIYSCFKSNPSKE